MAQRVLVTVTDDLDGSADASPVQFSLRGVTYEIDLNEKHTAELEEALAPYIKAGRKPGRANGTSSASGARRSSSSGGRRSDASAVRAWAKDNGYDLSDRGRISAEIRQAYEASQS